MNLIALTETLTHGIVQIALHPVAFATGTSLITTKQCDHCQKWIHTQCCAIDDNAYKQLIHSSCSWACPDCNNFNFTNSFFEDSEIQTENPFDPLNGNNHNSNETTTSSNNTTNNKKTYKQKNRPNFRCILINCQSIKNKAADIKVLNNLHNPDIISATESWLDPSVKNGEIFPEHFNVFRKDRETSTTGGGGGIPNIQS